MSARLLSLQELADDEIDKWRDLARSAAEPNPFLEPDFVLPAAAHLRSRAVRLLVVDEHRGWEACLPVARRRVAGIPVPVTSPWLHPYCFLATPLVRLERAEDALAALVDRATSGLRTGPLALEWLGVGGAVGFALESVVETHRLRAETLRTYERATLTRRPEPVYHEGMRPHHRRELRRTHRALERESGPLRVVDRGGDPTAVEDFIHLEARGWKGRAGTAFASSPAHAAFLREACRRFAAAGRLQLLDMTAGTTRLAMKCNMRAADAVFCFKIAFDEGWARFSPGVQLELHNVEKFHAGSATWMDSCAAPDNDMINRLWPDRRSISTVVVSGSGPLGRTSQQGVRAIRAIRRHRRRVACASS